MNNSIGPFYEKIMCNKEDMGLMLHFIYLQGAMESNGMHILYVLLPPLILKKERVE